ncbi:MULTISPECIES: LolA family protein [Dyella]|uniref:Outer membrane lipoprotein carrier protein LolA n=2 Tax=Dyella TaxID=231454 RepID=A0A4R0YTD0_9GAMM|nr:MULTISPECIES: outer membrane lipoprotein carrier protein LolA [Dyella]TBR39796.1 outer membrane lipoprotein carrier protein LolA [Dyella terrae]TCI12625.1 outer membrane lipoprotein carrier protein LolA [Dyella soli]
MRHLIAIVFALLAMVAVAHANEPDLLHQVVAQLGQHAQVRAAFTQTRENPALAQPQVSRGQLLFVTGQGMLWQVQAPYVETIALTHGRSSRVDEQGHPLSASSDRGVAQVSQMLDGLLAGQPDDALRQFSVEAEGSLQQWTLRFTPRQSRMARVLRKIELRGDTFLQKIQVDMQSGESTHIQFVETRDAGPLTVPEQRALGMPP